MYVYELAVATGERSADLVERARMLGLDIGPSSELTREQVHLLNGGPLPVPDAMPGAALGAPPEPFGAEPEPEPGAKKPKGKKAKAAKTNPMSALGTADGPVEADGSEGPDKVRMLLLALPLIIVMLGVAWFVTKDGEDVGDNAPDPNAIGEQVTSNKLTGDPFGVADSARFCDAGGRLIVLGATPRSNPKTETLKTMFVTNENKIRDYLATVVTSTEGDTQAEARKYQAAYLGLIEAVRNLPPGYVSDLSADARAPLYRAAQNMAYLKMPLLDAAIGAHC